MTKTNSLRGKYRKFSTDEQEMLKHLYPKYNNDKLAAYFGTSVSSLLSFARRNGLHKSRELIRERCRKGAERTNEIRWGHN